MQVGQRNKNWLNVRYNANNNWLGQVGSDNNGYAQFEHPLYGLRAADKVLLNYKLRHNLDTVEDVINRFAPPSDDNPTENYINFVYLISNMEYQYLRTSRLFQKVTKK